jgi:uncharacterized membrane protein
MSTTEKPAFRAPLMVSLAAILVMLAASAALWWGAPDGVRVPLHWNMHGEVDRYGGKLEAALLPPGIAMLILGLLALAPWLEPRRRHLMQSARAYGAVWMGVAVLLAAIHAAIVLTALGVAIDILALIGGLTGALFLVMGNYFGKMRSTFVMGVRTPWTLSSDRVWDRTHRLAGRLFMAVGAVTLTLAILGRGLPAIAVLAIGGIGVALVSVVYSYLLWRRETKHSSTGG